ncbi:hypothetical protein N9W00_01000 [Arcobacteraceae bacterium]|nr:hypothetical protein [Arcobacteraceae bacterium]
MNEIIESIKKSTIEIKKIIAQGDMGKSEEQNSTGDTQLKLDIISDVVIENNFKLLKSVKQIVSEEQEHIVDINDDGEYLIAYDPLDGGMVPDLHHILLRGGGLFSYPGASDKPKGKLRQLFEVFPFAHVFETAGGGATDGQGRVLEIETTHIHDTSPCFFGSNEEINRVIENNK